MQLSQRTINFDSLYEDFGELLEAAGFRKVLNKDTVKEARITVAWHLVVGRPLPAIEQLTEGNLIVIMLVVKFFLPYMDTPIFDQAPPGGAWSLL